MHFCGTYHAVHMNHAEPHAVLLFVLIALFAISVLLKQKYRKVKHGVKYINNLSGVLIF